MYVLLTYQKKSHLKPSQVSLKNQISGQSVSNYLDIPTPNVAFYGTITPRRVFEMSADFHEPKTCKLGVSWRFIWWVLGQCCGNRGFRIEMGGSTVSHNPFHLQLSPNNAGAWPSKWRDPLHQGVRVVSVSNMRGKGLLMLTSWLRGQWRSSQASSSPWRASRQST